MLRFLVVAPLMLLGCSSPADDAEPEGPTSCDWVEDRMGTYLSRSTETDGNCGPIPDALGRIDNSGPLPEGCVLDAEDRVTENGCKLERSFSCTQEADGLVFSYVAVTTQQDEAGAHITGKLTMIARDLDGATLCVSTYTMRADRQ